MLKVNKKYLGTTLKKDGITIVLEEGLSQGVLTLVENRFGKKYVSKLREKKDVEDTERPSE